jgi:hypothetical protein
MPAPVYVNAVFCTDIVRESQTDLLTAIRVTNAFTVQPAKATVKFPDGRPPEQQIIYPPIRFHAVITFWCSEPREFTFVMKGYHANGQELDAAMETKIKLPKATLGGHTINLHSTMPGLIPGVFWFDFCIDGVVVTRQPLVILHGDVPKQLDEA